MYEQNVFRIIDARDTVIVELQRQNRTMRAALEQIRKRYEHSGFAYDTACDALLEVENADGTADA